MTTEQALIYVRKFEWLTTALNPLLPGYAEPRGWKCHAVQTVKMDTLVGVRMPAACGLRARHGWAADLFITKKCARCLVALGVQCKTCSGTGRAQGYAPCLPCLATGECKELRERS
jgi:hypothetical protein